MKGFNFFAGTRENATLSLAPAGAPAVAPGVPARYCFMPGIGGNNV